MKKKVGLKLLRRMQMSALHLLRHLPFPYVFLVLTYNFYYTVRTMTSLPDTQIVLQILLSVGIIVITAKYLGVLAKKIGIPQVAGEIVAGLLLRFIP